MTSTRAQPIDLDLMRKGERTRAAILKHALAAASKTGLESLTIGGLARATGLSKSGLFAHFESKENLQIAVLDLAVERFVENVVRPTLAHRDGVPRIRALLANWLDWTRDPSMPGGCLLVAAANELDDKPGPARDRLLAYHRQWLSKLADRARAAVESGDFRADTDPEQFAFELEAMLLSFHHFSRLLRDPHSEQRVRDALDRLIDNFRVA